MIGTPQSRFDLLDGSGITRALLDQNGVGLSRGTYSAWGSSTGYTPGTPLAWNGRAGCYSDPETGLLFMGARYYSPSIGRFVSRDPSGFGGGINLYSYCGGDPINYLDPLGLSFEIDTPFGTPFWVLDAQGFDAAQDTSRDALHSVFTLGRFQPSEESQNSPGYAAAYRGAAVGAAALGVAGIGAVGAAAAPYVGVMPALAAPAVLPALAASNPAAESEEIPAVESACAQAAEDAAEAVEGVGASDAPAVSSGRVSYGTPQGQLIRAPAGYQPMAAQNGKGLVLSPQGQALGNNSNIIRWGEPGPNNPDGYFRYYNGQGQPLNPATGLPGPNSLTHISPGYKGPLIGFPGG